MLQGFPGDASLGSSRIASCPRGQAERCFWLLRPSCTYMHLHWYLKSIHWNVFGSSRMPPCLSLGTRDKRWYLNVGRFSQDLATTHQWDGCLSYGLLTHQG